jgi:mannose-6-phosphate isomerase-like protein (cupin superfamily)
MSADATTGHRIAGREDALDFMAGYPGYGEQRWYSDALGSEEVSFSWRRMPPGTGGRGSYGHRHPGHEEIYFVISGTVTFKVGPEVFEAGPQSAVRMTGREFYSVHNDTEGEAQLLIVSARVGDMPLERLDGFWPEPPAPAV